MSILDDLLAKKKAAAEKNVVEARSAAGSPTASSFLDLPAQQDKSEAKEELSSKEEPSHKEKPIHDKPVSPLQAKLDAIRAAQQAAALVAAPAIALSSAIQEELTLVKDYSTIEVDGKWLTLEELLKEIERFKRLVAVSPKLFEAKLAAYLMKAEELEELQAQYTYRKTAEALAPVTPSYIRPPEAVDQMPSAQAHPATFALDIVLNEFQLAARDMALAGKSFTLIGPAGSGKTTAQRAVAMALLEQGRLHRTSYKKPGTKDRLEGWSFAACAYTRRASSNLARAIHSDPYLRDELPCNIMTIHALLEFHPVIITDPNTGRDTMRFIPNRDANNLLDITHLVIEEASMVGLDLWAQLYDALPSGVQIIFIGDINQLPPVFGPSILNYALVQLPVIELKTVYRQKGDSGILDNAHAILRGDPMHAAKDVFIIEGKSAAPVGQERMALSLSKMFEAWYEDGTYDPEEDMILTPFNKQPLGTKEMNKHIAQFLGRKRGAIVYEVIAGFEKHYLAKGDRVMVDKMDGVIVDIILNPKYMGVCPQVPSANLTRYGAMVGMDHHDLEWDKPADKTYIGYESLDIDKLLDGNPEDDERKLQCSHIVSVLLENGFTATLTGAGDFNGSSFSLGYVLTVHKAQGCEFRHVFGILHKDHSIMAFRELLYTLSTRARAGLYMIAKRFMLDKAVRNPRIKGNSLEEKIAFFNTGAVDMTGGISCTK
jgi:hypothetical protein